MFYAVGVGPGDPAWMTRQACDVLGFCPVIAAPRSASGEMPALEVARGAVDLSRKSIVPLKFTAARARSARNAEYVRAASSIARVLDAGLSVAMVNLGDVSICATAYDVLDELRPPGIRHADDPRHHELLRRCCSARHQSHRQGLAAAYLSG